MTVENFQVDLRGVVDLFSHHLYSSPRVYVRELLQNAVDAIAARRQSEPTAPARVTVTTSAAGGLLTLTVTDTGIGLRPEEVRTFLATIGRSSKRDELGFARHEFIGQFGIGLLATFLVADTVTVYTRAAGQPIVRWVGSSAGHYVVDSPVESPTSTFPEIGTQVTLTASRDAEHWFDPTTVAELVDWYGSLLPVAIEIDGTPRPAGVAPWEPAGSSRAAVVGYAQDQLGLTPFDAIPLVDHGVGLRGIAYVLSTPANPAERPRHRVYLKRMLLSDQVQDLLPDWAYFVRAVIDTTELRPTASREALFDDGALAATRESLGDQIRTWIVRLGTTEPRRLAQFLDTHQLGVKSLALFDDELLALVYRWITFETSVGNLTIDEVQRRHGEVRYVGTVQEFRQLAQIAPAHGVIVVNGGYVYGSELIERMRDVLDVPASPISPTDVGTALTELDRATERALKPFLDAARRVLEPAGCDVLMRAFDPVSLPGLYLIDRSARQRLEHTKSRERADPLWGQVLDALTPDSADARPQLVLNHRHPVVRRLSTLSESTAITFGVEAIYGQALLQGQHPLRPSDQAMLTRTMLGLLDSGLAASGPGDPIPPGSTPRDVTTSDEENAAVPE